MALSVDILDYLKNADISDVLKARIKALPQLEVISGENIWRDFCAALPFEKPLYVADVDTIGTIEGESDALVLTKNPSPSYDNVEKIASALTEYDGLVAIGSGTLNDLCKYTAYKHQLPYAVFATALSMNGYVSANASIIEHDKKHTKKAAMPCLVGLDDAVLRAAPERLTKAGFGDAMCRCTSQADWYLSYITKGTDYDASLYEMLYASEKRLIQAAENGKIDTLSLAENLILSGLCMTLYGNSHPASQGEHAIAHYMETQEDTEAFHGEQIAVTTLSMLRIQEEMRTKHNVAYNDALDLDHNTLLTLFKNIAMPLKPKDIGWSETLYNDALHNAHAWRNRYGYLNLANDG